MAGYKQTSYVDETGIIRKQGMPASVVNVVKQVQDGRHDIALQKPLLDRLIALHRHSNDLCCTPPQRRMRAVQKLNQCLETSDLVQVCRAPLVSVSSIG